MVPRDRYSRMSLILQSFPSPIIFARVVTRNVSKRFYYSDRSALVSGVIWRDILERGALEYVSPLRRILAKKSQRIRREGNVVTTLYVNSVASARKKKKKKKRFCLKISCFKNACPSRPLFRPANIL